MQMQTLPTCLLMLLVNVSACSQAATETWHGEYSYSVVLGGPQGAPTASRDYVLTLG